MTAWAALPLGMLIGGLIGFALAVRVGANRRKALSGPLHELRGALAAIQLGLLALERRVPSKLFDDRLDVLRTQAERARVAVDDVDDIRLARTPGHVRRDLVELGALVRRRVAAWSSLAEMRRRAVELRWTIGPAVVCAEPARIGQALDNLIVNALDHGSGLVRVTGVMGDDTVRVAVSDQGPGISRPLREVMRSPWQGRHGHGLAVAARVAELHGGRLTAGSARTGSRVEIELPLVEAPRARDAVRAPGTRASPLSLEPVSSGTSS